MRISREFVKSERKKIENLHNFQSMKKIDSHLMTKKDKKPSLASLNNQIKLDLSGAKGPIQKTARPR